MIGLTNMPRLVSGDQPTGRLHLGHWVGSLENRIALQEKYECYIFIANLHAFTTRARQSETIQKYTLALVLDYLAIGIDPKKSIIFIQSEVPALSQLAVIFSMLLSFSRVMRNPTLKDTLRTKKLGDNYSVGLFLYPICQAADILAFQPELVPVGEDQLPHIEMTRQVARRFNQWYCGVDPNVPDEQHQAHGGLFPIVQAPLARTPKLIGLGPPNEEGKLLKMSKSLNNTIGLCDDPDIIQQKVMSMYTDPMRLRATDPGRIENNPLWIFHQTFNPDKNWVLDAMDKYQHGEISDVECKRRLVEVLVAFTQPIRDRRKLYASDPAAVINILREGTRLANATAEKTLIAVKKAIHQDYFSASLSIS